MTKDLLGAGRQLIIFGIPSSIILFVVNWLWFPELKFLIVNEVVNSLVGFLFLIPGILLWITSVREISKFTQSEELVKDGIYSRVRHPLYSAIILLVIPAIIIFMKFILGLVIPLLMILTFNFSIKKEETALVDKYGDEYREYMKKVKKLVPGIY
ncbi:MAG: methyltransferase family protein [Promethearchaeota archaeon]